MESDSASVTESDHCAALKALPPPFVNAAGSIQNLLEEPCGGVAIIHSKAGSTRSQHFHREDSHYLYVVSGLMLYYERPVGSVERPEPITVKTGQMVYTPPLVEHATVFPVDTMLVSMSKRPRDTASHEADLVRVKVI